MASTEKLVVELEAKLGNSTKSLDSFEKSIDDVGKSTKSADSSLASFAGTAKSSALAITAAVTAFTAFVTITAKSRKELQLLASTANDSVKSFESTAFALKTFGLEASDTAQLLNDVTEAASEFANVGAGPFQDLADQIGLTTKEASILASEVKELSGTDAMVKLINVVNDAGLSFADSNQALKAISSDFQFLTPLIKSNGAELQLLADRYNKANAELAITAAQEKDLAALADTSKLLTDQLGNAATLISASFAPIFNDFFNAVITIVPKATNTLVDFFNTFQNAESINSINSLDREIEELTKRSADYEEQLQSLLGGEYITTDLDDNIREQADGLSIVNQRLFELEQQREKLIEQQDRFSKVNEGVGGSFSTGEFEPSPAIQRDSSEDNANELAMIEERFKSEELLLEEKLLREQEIIGDNHDLQVDLYSEYLDNLDALDQKRLSLLERQQKDEANAVKKTNGEKLDETLAYTNAAISLGNLLFEDNKAIKRALVVVDTAAGITKAFAELPFPAAAAASAAIATSGAAQLSAINSASKGGGSSASAPSATTVDTSLPDETPELSVSASDTSGSNQSIIIKFEGSGDDITEAIANNMKVMQVGGLLE